MRNPTGLLLRRWGTLPASILRPPESEGIVRADGLPASYGTSSFIALGLFNQWLKELTAFLKDGERTGLFPWKGYIDTEELSLFNSDRGIAYLNGTVVRGSDGNAYICQNETDNLTNDPVEDDDNSHWSLLSDELTEYLVGGLVLGSDGMIYRCKQAADSHTQDPVTDSANTVWEPFIQTLPEGTETVQGTVRIATLTEAVEGTATNRVVTDAGVAAAINERIQQLVSDGVVDDVRLTGDNNSVLRLRRTQGLSTINVDLSPLLTTFAPLLNATLTGDVNVPEPPTNENSRVLATTAFARRVGNERWNQRASTTQTGIVRAANATELTGRVATGVYVDLAGLESRLAEILGLPGNNGPEGFSVRGQRGLRGEMGFEYRTDIEILHSVYLDSISDRTWTRGNITLLDSDYIIALVHYETSDNVFRGTAVSVEYSRIALEIPGNLPDNTTRGTHLRFVSGSGPRFSATVGQTILVQLSRNFQSNDYWWRSRTENGVYLLAVRPTIVQL